jgi:hypothetical protein
MEQEKEIFSIRNHPYLDCKYIEENKEVKDRCSRCGGEHYDLSCIYFRNNQDNLTPGKTIK